MSLQQQFLRHWQAKGFDKIKAPHLLALSGGMDSMVLAHLLLAAEIPFAVAHINFKLRGADADADEAFVKSFAVQHNLPCYTTSFDTQAIATAQKKSIQETARDLRYQWLRELREEHGYGAIITAHHADDNAETLLINLLRGTGVRGLHGIPEFNSNILRPLLFASKEDIKAFAETNGVAYREDASNASDKYLRNAIRHKVLPAFQEVMPDVVQRLNDNISRFAEGEMLYQKALDTEIKKLLEKRGADYYIPIRKLIHRQPLHTICYELCRLFGFSSAQTPDILNLLTASTGAYILSPTHRLIRNRDFLILTAAKTDETDFVLIESIPATMYAGSHQYTFKLLDAPTKEIDPNPFVALIDASALHFPLILRRWRTGDYFYPLGMGMKKKKLSRFFIDQKLPLHHKEQIWVLESDKRIVWLPGLRLDERFKIRDTTRQALRIEVKPR